MINLAGRVPIIYCDFDGTVTTTDVTDVLLEKLADPLWKVIEERWVNGEIDDCQCMGEQVALIRGKWADITCVLDSIKIDAHFKAFVDQCKKAAIPIYIGSNGIDKVISYILKRERIELDDAWAYHLIESDQGWALQFPMSGERGVCRAPHSISCKCVLLEDTDLTGALKPYRIVIGDSQSDFCWANKADLVFAKNKLVKYCTDHKINNLPFADFSQISTELVNSGVFQHVKILK